MEESFEKEKKDNTLLIIICVLITLFLGIIGAVIAYFLLKEKEPKIAKILLIIGVVLFLIGMIFVGLAFFYALGLTKPCRWVGTQISISPEFVIPTENVRMSWSEDKNSISFKLQNNKPSKIDILPGDIKIQSITGQIGSNSQSISLGTGESINLDIELTGGQLMIPGDCYTVDITITYIENSKSNTATGKISGIVR